MLDCQLLHVSRAPPAAAAVDAGADRLLLVTEPGLEGSDLPAGGWQLVKGLEMGWTVLLGCDEEVPRFIGEADFKGSTKGSKGF